MPFALPRRVFDIPLLLVPHANWEELYDVLTVLATARYPHAIVQAAEYDIRQDVLRVAILHDSFPLQHGPAVVEPWDAPRDAYDEPIPCAPVDERKA